MEKIIQNTYQEMRNRIALLKATKEAFKAQCGNDYEDELKYGEGYSIEDAYAKDDYCDKREEDYTAVLGNDFINIMNKIGDNQIHSDKELFSKLIKIVWVLHENSYLHCLEDAFPIFKEHIAYILKFAINTGGATMDLIAPEYNNL